MVDPNSIHITSGLTIILHLLIVLCDPNLGETSFQGDHIPYLRTIYNLRQPIISDTSAKQQQGQSSGHVSWPQQGQFSGHISWPQQVSFWTHPGLNICSNGLVLLQCSLHLRRIAAKVLVWQNGCHVIEPGLAKCCLVANRHKSPFKIRLTNTTLV